MQRSFSIERIMYGTADYFPAQNNQKEADTLMVLNVVNAIKVNFGMQIVVFS